MRESSSFLVLLLATGFLGVVHGYKNIFGDQLQPCSSEGMALTGYTRTGYCVDQDDDNGSHHICIDLSSTRTEQNFCEVTGQNDWCSDMMPCDDGKGYQANNNGGDGDSNQCQVQNWCVCQWAFASYLQAAGGCDYVQDLECQSINQQAIIAYKQQMNQASKYLDALECIANRCGVSIDDIPTSSRASRMSMKSFNSQRAAAWALVVIVAGAATGAVYYTSRRQTAAQVGEGAYLATNDNQVTKGAVG